jgi:hypothetical protein
MNACFLASIFASGENFSFFLAMDDFEPIVGGVYNIFDAFFDDGGVVADIADDIDDGDVDDEVDTAGFPSGKYTFRRSIDLPA